MFVTDRILNKTRKSYYDFLSSCIPLPPSPPSPPSPLYTVVLPPVNLGMAANFAILTKTGITNVSPTSIDGSIATSPISELSITGFTL
jgi:hypothetical protein